MDSLKNIQILSLQNFRFATILLIVFMSLINSYLHSQTFHMVDFVQLWSIEFNGEECDACTLQAIGTSSEYGSGLSFSPEGNLYGIEYGFNGSKIHQIAPHQIFYRYVTIR